MVSLGKEISEALNRCGEKESQVMGGVTFREKATAEA